MIKLLTSIAGADFSYAPGEKVTLDENTERRLVESGQAEYVNENRAAIKPRKPSGKS